MTQQIILVSNDPVLASTLDANTAPLTPPLNSVLASCGIWMGRCLQPCSLRSS